MTSLQTGALVVHVGVPAIMALGYLIGSGRTTDHDLPRRLGHSLGLFAWAAWWLAVGAGLNLLLAQALSS